MSSKERQRIQGKTLRLAGVLSLLPGIAFGQTIGDRIDGWFDWSTGWFVSYIFLGFPGTDITRNMGWLVIAASAFTVYFGFIQLHAFVVQIPTGRTAVLRSGPAKVIRSRNSLEVLSAGNKKGGKQTVATVFHDVAEFP